MPTLYVKDIPDDLYRKLKVRAEKERRSISAETIVLLEEAFGHSGENSDIMASVKAIRAKYRLSAGKTLVELLREDRER
ncbi:MAG: hypothetical protein HZA08_14255 [Nitrospirae bacterium]|nr:hypothetical protein [Nitrospirota bacterium]